MCKLMIKINNKFLKRKLWISYFLLEKDFKGNFVNLKRHFIIRRSHEITSTVPLNMINH